MKKRVRSNIANFVTILNLLCGCFAIYFLFREEFMMALWFILLAAFFDFADGFVARLLRVKSDMGKQLDSLADVVSFGLAPGIAMFLLISNSIHKSNLGLPDYFAFIAFIIPLFSAWRLAKFNIDVRQSTCFYGLPTPANALFIFSLLPSYTGTFLSPFFPWHESFFQLITNPYFLIILTIVLSVLLVVNLRLFALKFESFSWKPNKLRYIFLGCSLVLILLFYFVAIPFIIILYILLSVIEQIIIKKKKK